MSWCLLRGQVMWWSRHLMRCNGLCCVMSRDAMRCHGDELYYSSTTLYYKVLFRTTNTALYYSVLLQYYPVLQSTTPVLTCTTKYYSNTTLYYKVLLLQSTTPILLCTTKYYSNTTPYYNTTLYYSSTTLYYKVPLKYYSVLLQYYLVLQDTTPVLPRTKLLQSTSWLIRITYETSFTMRRATKCSLQLQQIPRLATQTESHDWSASHMKRHLQCAEQQGITFQLHQKLRLPRKMNLMIDPHHIWNVIYNARSNSQHPPTSPNIAPATQNESHDWSTSHMKRHLQYAEQQASTLQLHQILRLPRKMNLMIDPHHIWNVIYNKRSNRHHPPTSPTTAPATQKECHDWSASCMKGHLHCAERQASPCNLTKYCACHAKGVSWLIRITYETSFTMRGATGITLQPHQILRLPRKIELPNLTEIYWKQLKRHFQCATDPTMIRAWSDPENAKLNPPRRQGYFSHSPEADSIENYNVSRSGYHSKFHHILRLPRKVTHELHEMLRLPRKVTHELHQMLRLPRKVTHELHQMLRLPRKSDTKWHMTTTTTTTTTSTTTGTTTTTTRNYYLLLLLLGPIYYYWDYYY